MAHAAKICRDRKSKTPAARRRRGKIWSRCCAWNRWPWKWDSDLVQLVEGGQNSPLLKRIASIRRQLATELGYILPPVRVTDNSDTQGAGICDFRSKA